MTTMKFGFGQALTRKEDDALLRGAGHYIADFAPAGALHAVMVRSPHAHARFRIGDLGKVRAMPGVRLVLTAADVAGLGPLPTPGTIPDLPTVVPTYPILVPDTVRHVGDAVAFVVADTLAQTKDAAEAISIDWQPLPHVIGAVAALKSGAPQVWPERPGNLAFETAVGDEKATREAFAKAARTAQVRIVNQRLVTNYMDTRGVVAEYDGERYTLTLGSQGSHIIRDIIGGAVLNIPPEKMHVITPDVGGGFGTKLFPYREYALAAVAAERLRKPVKWVADRSEHFLGDSQGRDNITTARVAMDEKGRFLALSLDIVADMGAYLSCYAPYIPWLGVGMAQGVYDIPVGHVRLRGVYTNTVPVDAYRGAGRPEAAYVIERLVDAAARETGIAPDVIRKRNFIKPKAMPYTTRPARSTTPAISPATWRARRRSPSGPASTSALRLPNAPASCAASAWPPISRPAAIWGRRRRRCDSTGRRRHGADRLAVDGPGPRHRLRAAGRRSSRHSPRARAHGAGRHRQDRDRRRHRRLELDPVRRLLARRRRQKSSRPRSSASPPMRSKPRAATWRSPTAACAWSAPTAPSLSLRLPRAPARR